MAACEYSLFINGHDVYLGSVATAWRLHHNLIQLSLNSDSAQVQILLAAVGDSRRRGSLTMVPAGNRAKRLSSVSYTTKTIHHHHHHHHFFFRLYFVYVISFKGK